MSVGGAAGARGALRDADLRAGAGRVRARRGGAALGLRRQGVPRLLRRALGPQRRPLPSADRRGDRASRRAAGRRLQPLLHRAGDAARASGSPSRASAARSSSATPAPRRTSARSSSPASTPTPAAIDGPEIVILDGGFHGRTLGALAATPRLAREDLFGPLPPGFVARPARRPGALRAAVGERTAAVMHRADPGRGGHLPDRRRGPGRRARGLRRSGRAARLRRGPDRDGEDRHRSGPTSSCRCART